MDLVLQVYIECRLGDNLVPTDTGVSRWAFQKSSDLLGVVPPTETSLVKQLWMLNESYAASRSPIRVEDHPKLGQFFKPLPTKYWEFVNSNQLGQYSYKYQRDDIFKNITSYPSACPKLATSTTTATQTGISPGTVAPATLRSSGLGYPKRLDNRVGRRYRNIKQLSSLCWFGGVETSSIDSDDAQELAIDFVGAVVNATLHAGGTEKMAFNQAELMECQYYNDNIADVEDYTPVFRNNFGLSPDDHPRCWDFTQ